MEQGQNKVCEISLAEKLTTKFTRSVGSPWSVVIHTIFFIGVFTLEKFDYTLDQILLILTTAVSLEAIYLAIFIQMTVNRQEARLHEVGEDIEEISEDVEGLSKDVDEIQEDIGEIQEDIDDIGEGVDDIGKDIDEISEDVDDLSEGMEEEDKDDIADRERLQKIEETLKMLLTEFSELRGKK